MKYLIAALIIIHGLIHLLGFTKAYKLAEITELTQPISKPTGLIWLMVSAVFLILGIVYLCGSSVWPFLAFGGVLISQILIIQHWGDAKFGTIANVTILLLAIQGWASIRFENQYRKDVAQGLARMSSVESSMITKEDLLHLPPQVSGYLQHANVIGKSRIQNMKVTMKGQMRSKDQDWFDFTAEQYNFFDRPERFFFMKAKIKGLPAHGYHRYTTDRASMDIRLLSLFPVVSLENNELHRTETVTFFNDLCLMAPAALLDANIKWKEIDGRSVEAIFANDDTPISAILHFDDEGKLIDFESNDRMDINAGKNYKFSTPISRYGDKRDQNLISYGEAVWHYPNGPFTYGRFEIVDIEYNVTK